MSAMDSADAAVNTPAAKQSLLSRLINRLALMCDNANALLVRHVRQQLRNRMFVSIFILLLTLACIASIACASFAKHGDVQAGMHLFGLLGAGMSFAVVVMTGHTAFRAISREREDQTWDLIQLTGLPPGKVVGGVIQSSLIQVMVYTSAMAPFMVLSYLLRGIDLAVIVFFLFWMLVASVASAALGSFLGCLGPNKATRAGLQSLLSLALVIGWLATFSIWFNLRFFISDITREISRHAGDFIAVNGMIVFFIALAIWNCRVCAAAVLTFRADNRSTVPRLTWMGSNLLALVAVIITVWIVAGMDRSNVLMWLAVSGVWLSSAGLIVGFFATTEDIALSPRQHRWIATAKGWRRWNSWWLAPGRARGRLACLWPIMLGIGLNVLAFLLVSPNDSAYMVEGILMCLAYCCCVLFFGCGVLLLGEGVSQLIEQRKPQLPAIRRLLVIAILMVLSAVPPVLDVLDDGDVDGFGIASPIAGTAMLINDIDRDHEKHGAKLLIPAFLGAAVAVTMIVLSAQQWRSNVKRIKAQAADHNPRHDAS